MRCPPCPGRFVLLLALAVAAGVPALRRSAGAVGTGAAASSAPAGTDAPLLAPDSTAPDFTALDALLEREVRQGRLPGAVVQVGLGERVLHRAAVGRDAPDGAPLTGTARFDLASLTKPLATATTVLALVRDGRVGLDDELAAHLPGFDPERWRGVTVARLLRHTAGLVPDHPLAFHADGPGPALERIEAAGPAHPPGTRFVYSDVGYLLLQALVERVTGESLADASRRAVFARLGLAATGFQALDGSGAPLDPASPAGCVPTRDPALGRLRGVVHDPRARALRGVAGHAGLFADVADVGRFAAWVAGGVDVPELDAVRRGLLDVAWLPDGTSGRTLGLDVDSAYASARGSRFPRGRSVGHTGFTGTSLWVDPGSGLSVVLLTSRTLVEGGSVLALRGEVADLAWEAVHGGDPAAPPVLCGADVLARDGCARLRGRRVGLLAHDASRTFDGTRTADLLAAAEGVELVRLFSPEHGLESRAEGALDDGRDAATGLVVHSLYGERRRPAAEQLAGLDDLVVDLQDVGVRIYTYPATVLGVLEACAEADVRVVLLDRPSPLLFAGADGPAADADALGFVNCGDWPWLPGATLGELARVLAAERVPGVDLEVVACDGLTRSMTWEDTGQPWRDPSPNLRAPEAAVLYASLGVLEAQPLSVGRGTGEPFERLGAPWVDGVALSEALRGSDLPGVAFTPIRFTPDAGPFAGEACGGLHVALTDRRAWRPLRTGLTLAWHLERLGGEASGIERLDRRLASRRTWEALRRTSDPATLEAGWAEDLVRWEARLTPYRLYR